MSTWCPHCATYSETHRDATTGTVCCVECGKVVSQDIYTEEATFTKDSSGAACLSGNVVKMGNTYGESHQRTLNKGHDKIRELIDEYGISNVDHARNYYTKAVERGFTRGRRTGQVAAACLYVACREHDKPFLLIEFSSGLGVSVYELGTVYLQLCKLLSLHEHPFVQRPTDPSLFMHRYTSVLMKGNKDRNVENTALQLAVSMKRDWIQTGRKPSGICAAAIYVASILHGYKFTKADVVKAVHICEATLTKRLIEFENTEAGSLTIEEFNQNAIDYETENKSCKRSGNELKMPGLTEVVCQHPNKANHSGFGLCKDCYMEFCGGLDGSEPPAFQRAEIERLSNKPAKNLTPQKTIGDENGTCGNMKEIDNECVADKVSESVDVFESSKEAPEPVDETDTLSDIDDSEVDGYLHDEEEKRYKKYIWEEINKEYEQEEAAKQAAKEAAAAAARKRYAGESEEIREAKVLKAMAAAEVASKKQKDKRKRELDAKNVKPAQTAAEAAGQHFKKRSSKINYEALGDLFGDDEQSPRVDDVSNDKGKEIVDEAEENYENEQQMNGYADYNDLGI